MNDECEGIVLKNIDYKDNDAILTILTKEFGKLSFVAKGIRKMKSKNANGCNLYNISTFYFNYQEQRTIQSLRTAENKKNFRKIREDLIKQCVASVMVEMMEKMHIDYIDDAYDLLKTSLENLEMTSNPMCLFGLYIAKCCDLSGINPYVDGCTICNKTKDLISISLIDGGFICVDCFDSTKHQQKDRSTLKFFRLFTKATIDQFEILEQITPCEFRDVEDLLDLFVEYSGVHLKSLKFLKHILEIGK